MYAAVESLLRQAPEVILGAAFPRWPAPRSSIRRAGLQDRQCGSVGQPVVPDLA